MFNQWHNCCFKYNLKYPKTAIKYLKNIFFSWTFCIILILFLFSAEFILEDPKGYNFLTAGGVKVPGIDDPEEFQSTLNSMKVSFFMNFFAKKTDGKAWISGVFIILLFTSNQNSNLWLFYIILLGFTCLSANALLLMFILSLSNVGL